MPSRLPVVALALGFARRLRFPWLFALTAALFAANLLLPDPLPYADEILLGLATLLLGGLRRRAGSGREPDAPEEPRRVGG
jgi:hypothetical protein